MGLIFKKASVSELQALVDVEIEVLCHANDLPEDVDLADIRKKFFHYYEDTLRDSNHVIFICYDGANRSQIIAVGGISFYKVMPTYQNMSGNRAQILNLYTHKDYQHKGVASKMLELLVFEAGRRAVQEVIVESNTTDTRLYAKQGFHSTGKTMVLELSEVYSGVPDRM